MYQICPVRQCLIMAVQKRKPSSVYYGRLNHSRRPCLGICRPLPVAMSFPYHSTLLYPRSASSCPAPVRQGGSCMTALGTVKYLSPCYPTGRHRH